MKVLSLQELGQVQVLRVVREDAEQLFEGRPIVWPVLPALQHDRVDVVGGLLRHRKSVAGLDVVHSLLPGLVLE